MEICLAHTARSLIANTPTPSRSICSPSPAASSPTPTTHSTNTPTRAELRLGDPIKHAAAIAAA